MRLDLVDVLATDKVQLPGLLYRPAPATSKVAVWLHGMGDSGVFYKPTLINALGKALTNAGIGFLALNNRGAHNIKTLKVANEDLPEEDQHYQGGTHYELIADCVYDINGAVDFLRRKNFSEFYLLGHSTGANKVCAYHIRAKKNPFTKYVLAGPGDDSGLGFTDLGEKKFWQAIDYARDKVRNKQPLHVMPRYTGMHPFSAQSALEILNPDGDYNTFPYYEYTIKRLGAKPLFKEYRSINIPLQVVFGENDEYAYTAGDAAHALGILRKHTGKTITDISDFRLIAGTDHSFKGAEMAFANIVGDWLSND